MTAAQEAVRETGGCGAVSPDGEHLCIKKLGECPPHGWPDNRLERVLAAVLMFSPAIPDTTPVPVVRALVAELAVAARGVLEAG